MVLNDRTPHELVHILPKDEITSLLEIGVTISFTNVEANQRGVSVPLDPIRHSLPNQRTHGDVLSQYVAHEIERVRSRVARMIRNVFQQTDLHEGVVILLVEEKPGE